jgi:hypothetical protein
MKLAQQQILATGLRADGKLVSELVKTELAKQPSSFTNNNPVSMVNINETDNTSRTGMDT